MHDFTLQKWWCATETAGDRLHVPVVVHAAGLTSQWLGKQFGAVSSG